jgi:hypothetical protein
MRVAPKDLWKIRFRAIKTFALSATGRIQHEPRLGDRIQAFLPLAFQIERFGLRENRQDLSLALLLGAPYRLPGRLVLQLRCYGLGSRADEGRLAIPVVRKRTAELRDLPRAQSCARCRDAKHRRDCDRRRTKCPNVAFHGEFSILALAATKN